MGRVDDVSEDVDLILDDGAAWPRSFVLLHCDLLEVAVVGNTSTSHWRTTSVR